MNLFLEALHACADPMRWRIIKLLQAYPSTCVCDLQEILSIPQSTLSSHLAVLRRASLLKQEKRATWVHYSLDEQLKEWIAQLESFPLGLDAELESLIEQDCDQAAKHPRCCPNS